MLLNFMFVFAYRNFSQIKNKGGHENSIQQVLSHAQYFFFREFSYKKQHKQRERY